MKSRNRLFPIFCLLLGIGLCCLPMHAAAAKTKSTSGKKVFRYVALGNSITVHPVCDFWYYHCGMGASEPSKDYVHQAFTRIQSKYKKEYSSFSLDIMDEPAWEVMPGSRDQTLENVKERLKNKPDLLTFHYGEGIRSLYNFEADLIRLVKLVQKESPGTCLVLMGNFWRATSEDRQADDIKKRVAEKYGVFYADLRSIAEKPGYVLGYTSLQDQYGNWHRVSYSEVARHPNDKAMTYMADRIVECLEMAGAPLKQDTGQTEAETETGQKSEKAETAAGTLRNQWKKVKKNGKTYRCYYGADGKKIHGSKKNAKIYKIGKYSYAFDSKGYMVTGVRLIKGKLYYFSSKGRLDSKKTKALGKAARPDRKIQPLKKLLKQLGCKLLKEEYYGTGCLGDGEDGLLKYSGFEIPVFRFTSGKTIILEIHPA